jgi:hypothetical protein
MPRPIESVVLERSRRRCAFCWGLEFDLGVKDVQIAHIDGDPSNNAIDNLVALCLVHHNQYDTTPRQTKRLTPTEAKRYRDQLYDILRKKRRTVEYTFHFPGGRSDTSTSSAKRLGLIIDSYDEDSSRTPPNGLGLLGLARHFIQVEGDFAAGMEALTSLLRLIDRDDADRIAGAEAFLCGQTVGPVASPAVSVMRLLWAARETDESLYLSFFEVANSWALYGWQRNFDEITIEDVPQPRFGIFCACLFAIAAGVHVPRGDGGFRQFVTERLVELVSRATVAYVLRGFTLPEKIERLCLSHRGRVAPGPNFVNSNGSVAEWDRGNWPPDAWFNAMHTVARLPPVDFQFAVDAIPKSLADWDALFVVTDTAPTCSLREARNLVDLQNTLPSRGVCIVGKSLLQNEDELAQVLEYARRRRAAGEDALRQLAKCLLDEHRLVWQNT